jgi:tetratricopeptide (TPR) repeat protein
MISSLLHCAPAGALALVSALTFAPIFLAAAEPAWRMLETPRFTVISQLGDKPTHAWAEEFSQFTEELRRVFRAERPHVPPLTVVLFARTRDFSRYKPMRPDSREPAAIGGLFSHQGNWSVIGLANLYTQENTRELIFHEAVHWFTSADPVIHPLWLSEGLAEVFSTFRQEKGRVHWGAAISRHVELLRADDRMLPFERFLYLTPDDPLFNQTERTGIFYAQSWVFVHYLLFGAHDGSRNALTHYFHALSSGRHPDEAFRQAFEQDYTTMARTLNSYIRNGYYETRIRPESPNARITGPTVAAPAPVVEVALARLALAADRLETARRHAERAVTLAPDQPGGHEVLAQVHERNGNKPAALSASLEAERLGSQDASTLFQLAYLSAEEPGYGESAAKSREIANLYLRVIAVSPTMEEAYENLSAVAPVLEVVEDADIAALKQGARMFPHRGEITLGLAALVDRRGDRSTARALLVKARRAGLPVDAERNATRMEDRWLYDETITHIESLLRAGQFADALIACDDVISRITDIYIRTTMARLRQDITSRARLAEADDALRTGDFVAARRLYEAMLADPAVPGNIRGLLEDMLRRLPAAVPTATIPGSP